MNCIATAETQVDLTNRVAITVVRCWPRLLIVMVLALCGCTAAATEPAPISEKIYNVMYTVTPDPRRGTATVEMRVTQVRRFLREVSMTMPAERFSSISGDGQVLRDGETLRWLPETTGGTLRWTVRVANKRYSDTYDAWLGKDWGLFRASDVIPPANTRTVVGAQSNTRMRFDLPAKWSAVTQYNDRQGIYSIKTTGRRFDRPTGWILLGKLGVRIETISGVRVVLGGPLGQNVRRLDMLALLHWTLPAVTKLIPDFPKRIAIVSAADGMWRGGLSGPNSLYIHADLPLISENATSTVLHEVLHIGSGLQASAGADWIVEGLAEFYALEILRRSRTISNARFTAAIDDQVTWGKQAPSLCTRASTAATTARAVGLFAALSRELKSVTMNNNAMDELFRTLISSDTDVSVADLRNAAKALAGRMPDALAKSALPGCF